MRQGLPAKNQRPQVSDAGVIGDHSQSNDLVVVLNYGGQARAYSTDALTNTGGGYIEIINDTIGTTPVAVGY